MGPSIGLPVVSRCCILQRSRHAAAARQWAYIGNSSRETCYNLAKDLVLRAGEESDLVFDLGLLTRAPFQRQRSRHISECHGCRHSARLRARKAARGRSRFTVA